MSNKLLIIFSLVLLAVSFASAAPFQVDLSQNGDVEAGWIDWNTGGTRLGGANVSKQFLKQAEFDDDFTIDFVKIDSRNRAQVNDAIPLHDLLEDAFKSSNAFDMVIKGLAPGVYVFKGWHHDPKEDVKNDDGTLNITVKDADGTRLAADHLQQSWGPKPAFVCNSSFTFRSDGTNNVTITFVDNNDGNNNEAYLNGFVIEVAVAPGRASEPQPDNGAVDVPRDVVLRWTPADTAPATNGHKVYFSKTMDEVKNGAARPDRGTVSLPEFDVKSLPFSTRVRHNLLLADRRRRAPPAGAPARCGVSRRSHLPIRSPARQFSPRPQARSTAIRRPAKPSMARDSIRTTGIPPN